MKNKRLIVILCVLAFLTVLVVVNSTLFTLQGISMNWLTTKYMLQDTKDYEIADEIELGQSVFLLNKAEITKKLEKSNPYLRVVQLETKFPNKLVVHCAERESLYSIRISNTQYAILDEMGKVLSIASSQSFQGMEASLGTKPIIVDFISLGLKAEDFCVGEVVSSSYVANLMTSLSRSFREASYDPTTTKGVIKSIEVASLGDFSQVSIMARNGMEINISDVESMTTTKLLLAFDRYNFKHSKGEVDCVIDVRFCESMNNIVANIYEK